MADFVTAAKISRWPVIDIVKLVLAGGLARIGVVASEKGFKAVRVDPDRVGASSLKLEPGPGLEAWPLGWADPGASRFRRLTFGDDTSALELRS